jgi:hypothetical protein
MIMSEEPEATNFPAQDTFNSDTIEELGGEIVEF